MNMKIRRKSALPVILLLCALTLCACDTYYYGLKETKHRTKMNGDKTMMVHKQTVNGAREFNRSRTAKPAAMYKQTKVIR